MNEHKALLLEFSGSALRVEDVLEDSDPTELWTAAPVESDDAELRAALQARAESDEEEADVSEAAVSMTLHEARSAAPALKIFARRPRRLGESGGGGYAVASSAHQGSDFRYGCNDGICKDAADTTQSNFATVKAAAGCVPSGWPGPDDSDRQAPGRNHSKGLSGCYSACTRDSHITLDSHIGSTSQLCDYLEWYTVFYANNTKA